MRFAPVVSALSYALDLSTGQPVGHSTRACLLGMRIAEEIELAPQARNDLFYGLLLKDCGCSSNASKMFHALGSDEIKAKRDVKTTDWTRTSWETVQYALAHIAPGKPFLHRVKAILTLALKQKAHAQEVTKIRCERGASLVRQMGLPVTTASAVLNLDEHWDGSGLPDGLKSLEIPRLSRIMLLAQTLEVYLAKSGLQTALDVVNRRSGTWFDPDLVKAVNSIPQRDLGAVQSSPAKLSEMCLETEVNPRVMEAGETALDSVCAAFSDIVDAKSPFTFHHSLGVADAAMAIARLMGFSEERVQFLRRAALLHDLGKLSVSNAILEKPAKLDAQEWGVVKAHPLHTWQVLRGIPGFGEMSEVAGSHHERLDGTGYFRGLSGGKISIEARILAVADIFEALSATRPYRESLSFDRVLQILREDSPHALDGSCVEALGQLGNLAVV